MVINCNIIQFVVISNNCVKYFQEQQLLVLSDKALLSLVQICDIISYGCFCSQYIKSTQLGQVQLVIVTLF